MMKIFLFILLALVGFNVAGQYTVKRIYFDTNYSTNDTLLIKDNTDSLFRLIGGEYIFAGKLKSKSMVISSEIVGWDTKQDALGFTPLAANGNGSALTGLTKTQVGLANVDNTSDANKPISTATQTALDGKLATNGNGSSLTGLTKTQVGLANVDNTSDAAKPVSTATQTALNLKANLASPTFTGTVSGITASMVGLGNVNNTSDASKPISTATQAALDGKQATLVSTTNIKTVNGNTLLGSGDLVVGGGATSSTSGVAATPTASGTSTITHNLGRTPTIIRIYSISSFTSNAAATPVPFSMGTWNSSGNRCIYMVINGTTTQVSQSSSVFSIIMVTSNGNRIEGVIGNVTNTGFDIVWTETGTHTAGNFLWEAQ